MKKNKKVNIKKNIAEYSPQLFDFSLRTLDFTIRSEEVFYDVDNELRNLQNKDAEVIYESLKAKLRVIPFNDYLKRYIFIKSNMIGDYNKIDIKEYQKIIVDTFCENYTPASFTNRETKIENFAKERLTRSSTQRQSVFLLGFGLNMSVDDVSSFLIKALRERDFNFKDPIEIIYWYCLKNKYKFSQMLKLKEAFEKLPIYKNSDIWSEKTIHIRKEVQKIIGDEKQLIDYLSKFKTDSKNYVHSITSYEWFEKLYLKTKEILVEYKKKDETEKLENQIQEYREEIYNSQRLSDLEKENHIKKMRVDRNQHKLTVKDITESYVEQILCTGTPQNENGSLVKFSDSTLSKSFFKKRMSRQHLGEIIKKKDQDIPEVPIDRFDLITLNFFIFSQNKKYENNRLLRYSDFINSTNEILNECSMGELYIANPYECFILMCIVSEDPFPNYTEVIAKSFEES